MFPSASMGPAAISQVTFQGWCFLETGLRTQELFSGRKGKADTAAVLTAGVVPVLLLPPSTL